MTDLPNDWLALVAVVFLLGGKHGMDPDHLATIDGLTRSNVDRPRISRWAGLLFSLGHGFVVTLVALLVATVARDWVTPAWFEHFGAWVSIVFLGTLGVVNLATAIRPTADRTAPVAGLKTRLIGPLARASHPIVIAAVGAAFALSFDTMSQTALFSLTGSRMLGWGFAVMLGGVFTLGMVATDTINGVWVARLVRRADARGQAAARAMSVAVGVMSIGIAAAAVARYFVPAADGLIEAAGLLAGGSVVLTIFLAYVVAVRMGGRRRAAAR